MTTTYGVPFDGPSAEKSLEGSDKLQLGTSTATADASGNLVGARITGASLVESGTLSPTSAATAGVTGQIAWDTTNLYVCTAGGVAGSATWTKIALTSV